MVPLKRGSMRRSDCRWCQASDDLSSRVELQLPGLGGSAAYRIERGLSAGCRKTAGPGEENANRPPVDTTP
jgi:hypothetical protein